jgi:tetratricopeptide (TPR) repeat protein
MSMKHFLYVILSGLATGLFLQTRQNIFLSSEASVFWLVPDSYQVWITSLLCVFCYLGFWVIYSLCLAAIRKEKLSIMLRLDAYTYLPSLLLAVPVLLRYNAFIFHVWHFSLVLSNDLPNVFIGVTGLGILWLKGLLWRDTLKNAVGRVRENIAKRRTIKFWQIELMVFLFSAGVYVTVGFHISRHKWPSGDEPHYLLIAHSLLVDRDLNLKNNLEEGHYQKFYPGRMGPWGFFTRGDRVYPVHMIGLPLMSMPFYYFGGRLGVVLFLNLLTAALVVLIFRLVYMVISDIAKSLIVCFFTAFSAPLLFYSSAIYPEVPIALLAALAYQKIKEPLENKFYNSLVVGLCIAYLPWLRERAVVLSLALLILYISYFGIFRKIHIPGFLVIAASGIFMFIYFAYMWFYSRTPDDISKVAVKTTSGIWGFFGSTGIFYLNIFLKQGALSLLFDQKTGLLFNAPIYLLIFPGMIWFLIHKKKLLLEIGLIIGPTFLLVASYLGFSGGESPPARYMVALAPFLIMLVSCYFIAHPGRIFKWIFAALGTLSLLISYSMVKTPALLTTLSVEAPRNNLLTAFYSSSIDVTRYLPSFILHEDKNYALVVMYVVFIGLFVGYHYVYVSPIFRKNGIIINRHSPLLSHSRDTERVIEGLKQFVRTIGLIFFALLILTVLIEQVVINKETIVADSSIENQRQENFLLALNQLETFNYSTLESSNTNNIAFPPELSLTYNQGKTGHVSSGPPSFLTAGPYVTLPGGEYEANFWLRSKDNSFSGVVVTLEVVTMRGKTVFTKRPIHGTDFNSAKEIQLFTLPFELDSATRDIETRVFFQNTVDIYLDKITITPKLTTLKYNIARFFEEHEEFDKAIEQYEALVTQNSGSSEIHYRLGLLYSKKGLFDQASTHLQQAIKLNNEYMLSHYQLARVYEMQNNWSKAASEYQIVLEKIPDHLDALIHLERCNKKLGEVDQAKAIEKRLVDLGVHHISYTDDFRNPEKFLKDSYSVKGNSKLWSPDFPGHLGAFPYKAEATLIYKFQTESKIDQVIIEDVHTQWGFHNSRQWIGDIVRMWTSIDGNHWTLRYDDKKRWGVVKYSQVFDTEFDDQQEFYIKYYFYAGDPNRGNNDNRGASLAEFSVDIYTKPVNQ